MEDHFVYRRNRPAARRNDRPQPPAQHRERHQYDEDHHNNRTPSPIAQYDQPIPCSRNHRYYHIDMNRVRNCCGFHHLCSMYRKTKDVVLQFGERCSTHRISVCDNRRHRRYKKLKNFMITIKQKYEEISRMYGEFDHYVATQNDLVHSYRREFNRRWKTLDKLMRKVPMYANSYENFTHHRPEFRMEPTETDFSEEMWTTSCDT